MKTWSGKGTALSSTEVASFSRKVRKTLDAGKYNSFTDLVTGHRQGQLDRGAFFSSMAVVLAGQGDLWRTFERIAPSDWPRLV